MMIIDWLPTGNGTVAAPLPLADVRDLAMAVDLAEVLASEAAGGFAVKAADGAVLYLSVGDGAKASPPRVVAEAAPRPAAPVKVESIRIAEAERPPASAEVSAGPTIVAVVAPGENIVPCASADQFERQRAHLAHATRPRVADLHNLTASNVEERSAMSSAFAGFSASAQARVSSAVGAGRTSGAALVGALRRVMAPMVEGAARRSVATVAPPVSLEGETPAASTVAEKLGVTRLVAAVETAARRRAFAGQVDYWILGAAAALLLFVGSPIYSIYATMSQVKAAEGRVLGSDIDIAHLRGSLQEEAAPARLAEGRSVANGARRVGLRTSEPADVVVETLSALARGPAFATISAGGRIDFRRLFWHLRYVSPREIDVRLQDPGDAGAPKTLVFRRHAFWSWKLFDLRVDRDA